MKKVQPSGIAQLEFEQENFMYEKQYDLFYAIWLDYRRKKRLVDWDLINEIVQEKHSQN